MFSFSVLAETKSVRFGTWRKMRWRGLSLSMRSDSHIYLYHTSTFISASCLKSKQITLVNPALLFYMNFSYLSIFRLWKVLLFSLGRAITLRWVWRVTVYTSSQLAVKVNTSSNQSFINAVWCLYTLHMLNTLYMALGCLCVSGCSAVFHRCASSVGLQISALCVHSDAAWCSRSQHRRWRFGPAQSDAPTAHATV